MENLMSWDRVTFVNQVTKKGVDLSDPEVANYYRSFLKSDIQNTIPQIKKATRFTNSTAKETMNLNFTCNDSLILDAFATIEDSSNVKLATSQGLWQSFDDLFFRLCCNRDFFSKDALEEKYFWSGCKCLWMNKGIWSPFYRYFDYRSNLTALPENFENSPDSNLLHSLSYFFRGRPGGNKGYDQRSLQGTISGHVAGLLQK
jgi:hypothetical protein